MREDPTINLSIKVPLSLYNALNTVLTEAGSKMTPFVRELIRRELAERVIAKLQAERT